MLRAHIVEVRIPSAANPSYTECQQSQCCQDTNHPGGDPLEASSEHQAPIVNLSVRVLTASQRTISF